MIGIPGDWRRACCVAQTRTVASWRKTSSASNTNWTSVPVLHGLEETLPALLAPVSVERRWSGTTLFFSVRQSGALLLRDSLQDTVL